MSTAKEPKSVGVPREVRCKSMVKKIEKMMLSTLYLAEFKSTMLFARSARTAAAAANANISSTAQCISVMPSLAIIRTMALRPSLKML